MDQSTYYNIQIERRCSNFNRLYSLSSGAIDEKGEILKAWTEETLDRIPAVAKAEAIFWAIQRAKLEHYQQVRVGDAYLCFDALNNEGSKHPWKFYNYCNDS